MKKIPPFQSKHKSYDVAIIGGGVIGIGIARKAAMQGFTVILIEKDEIGSGTSGHFHELLHSGARYAVHDPAAAKECYEENQALCSEKSFVKDAIDKTGGLFLAVTDADIVFSEELISSCQKIGIPVEEADISKVYEQEPNITKKLKRALHVPDGFVDGKKVLDINKKIAQAHGAVLLTHHEVIHFQTTGNHIEALKVHTSDGEEQYISCGFVINAAGAWAGQIGRLAEVEIPIIPYRGALIDFEDRLCTSVLNRCHKPANGDIFVPAGTHTIFGTTAKKTDDIDNFIIEKDEIDLLLHEGEILIPGISKFSIMRKYAGVRPLYSPAVGTSDGREISRSFTIINHKEVDDINNFISVVGGKFTIYERMCDKAIQIMQQNLYNKPSISSLYG